MGEEENKNRPKDQDGEEEPENHAHGQEGEPAGAEGESQQPESGDHRAKNPLEEALISMPIQDYEALQNEVEASKNQANEYFEGWQRERADFSNYKRRIERDQSQMAQNLGGSIIKKYLVIVDDLERALRARPNVGEGGAWSEGIELIYRKLLAILESEGVTRMPAENEMFDPNRHEAIIQEDSPEHESGQIIEVVQPGYIIGDRVLRPAVVKVAR